MMSGESLKCETYLRTIDLPNVEQTRPSGGDEVEEGPDKSPKDPILGKFRSYSFGNWLSVFTRLPALDSVCLRLSNIF